MPSIHYQVPELPYLGKGSMLLDIFDENGLSTGFQHLGNCSTVEQEIKDDKAELFQHMRAVPTLTATAVKKRVVSLKMSGTDFSSDHLAIATMADGKSTLAVANAAIAGEVLASATAKKKGRYFFTAGRNLDPATVAIAGLTVGTDYKVLDPVEGVIYFPLTSGVDDAAAVSIDYSTVEANFDQVAGCVKPFQKGRLRFVPDPTDGEKIGVEWWLCNLTPSGKIELIKDDYGNWELEVMVLSDDLNHPDAPYFLATYY